MPNNGFGPIEYIALIAGILTIAQFIFIIVQMYKAHKTKKEFGVILSTIERLGADIKEKASACSSADITDRTTLISSIETAANSIMIDIEEFRRHHWGE